MSERTERLVWLDIAKGIGILSIVLGHTLQGTVFLRQYTYAFSVPFFFLLSGITYRIKPARTFYFQKLRRLVLPYLTFAFLSILLFIFFGKFAAATESGASAKLLPNLFGALYANSRTGWMKWNVPLWFLPCMLGAFCIVDAFERCLLLMKKGHTFLFRSLFAAASAALFSVLAKFCSALMLPLQLETAFLMAAFMELGILLSHSALMPNCQKPTAGCRSLLFALAGLGAGALISLLNGYADIRIHRFGASLLAYLCGALLISGGLIALSVRLAAFKKTSALLSYVGQHTMGILLMHKFPILVFQALIPFSSSLLTQQSGTVSGMLWACAVSVIATALCLLVEKMLSPWVPWAFGNRR